MLIGLAQEMLTLTAAILEGVLLALVGVKPSKRSKRTYKTRQNTKKRSSRTMLNDRAMQRLSGKLLNELPRDVAISVLNDVKRYGMEV